MAKFAIYSKDGNVKRHEGEPRYNGSYLNVSYLEFGEIASPVPIPWQIGDYVDYYRTGMRYKLYTLPEPDKRARKMEYGGAFVYSNVQFHSATKDLEIALFRDIVTSDNEIHFSTMPDVNTFENVYGIAKRIQACMDDIFPKEWVIKVHDFDADIDSEITEMISEAREFSVSDGTCLDALGQIYEVWPNIGWVHTYDKTTGKNVITIGRANTRDAANTSSAFGYGKGKGLKSIRKAAANSEFATRLYVYGSERNIQPRYYNSLDIKDNDSVNITHLMLPLSEWGKTDGKPDAKQAFLQADDSLIEKFGLIPRTVYFDGQGNNKEIFPSIEGVTYGDIRRAKHQHGEISYIPDTDLYPDDTRADEFIGVMNPHDDGVYTDGEGGTIKLEQTFHADLGQIGFDMMKQAALTSEGKAIISVKSGMCAGREFVVKGCKYDESVDMWRLTLQRSQDDSLGMLFPNASYMLLPGDRFVLLEIAMPQLYINMASIRLLEHGMKMLKDYTKVSAFYEPEPDSIVIKKDGGILTEGMYMQVYDDDIVDTENHTDYVLIDTISIDEDGPLPEYKITLREQKRSARTFSALEDMIKDAKYDSRDAIKKQKQYTERLFRASQETLTMLQSAFDNFSGSINPVTVETMAMLLGDESLQFRFTANRNSLKPIQCPLDYNTETKQLTSQACALIHMTLGINTITAAGGMKASDYRSWNVQPFHSEILEDPDKKYYVYVKADKEQPDAVFILSESPIKMEDQEGYYHFLTGTLGAEYAGERSLVTLYGFTEVLPGQITTDILRSASGRLVIDLANAIITATDGARFIGDLTIGSGSSGLENLSEWKDKQAQIDNAHSKINELQDQVDGVIESFNGFGEPTLSNFPADEWTTDAERKRHNRDIYTDITPYVDDSTTPTAGQSWKWYYNSATDYGWTKIADSEAVKALQLARMSVLDTDVLFIQTSSQTEKPQLPAVNSSGIITDMKGWSTDAPAWKDGMYIWQATYVRKGDGGASFSDPTCVSGKNGEPGKDGAQGPQGVPGPAGADGKTTYTWIRYADNAQGGGISNDPTGKKYIGFAYNKAAQTESNTPSDYKWSLIEGPQGVPGQKGEDGTQYYTWIKYSDHADGTDLYDIPKATTKYIGIAVNKPTETESSNKADYTWSLFKGADGTSVTITSTSIQYASSSIGTSAPTSGWSSTIPSIAAGRYLWTRTIVNYSDGTSTTSYAVSRAGTNGAAGVGIKTIANKYALSNSNTSAPTSWQENVPTMTAANRYLWNYEIITYTDGSTAETDKRVIGVYGDTGSPGATGNGIQSITEHYLASASSSGVTTSTAGWTTTIQTITNAKRYLWNYETIRYTDGTSSDSTPVIIGVYGDQGIAGADGRGVLSTAVEYQIGTNGTTAPTGTWSTSVPAAQKGKYLWTRTTVTYTTGNPSVLYSVAYYATDGTDGKDGVAGKDGVGIASTVIKYARSVSSTVAPTSGWTTTIPGVPSGDCLWTWTRWTYTDGTTEDGYSVARQGTNGADGADGADGTSVTITSTETRYAKGNYPSQPADSAFTLTSIGTLTKGQYLWTRTTVNYSDGVQTKSYTVAYIGTDGEDGIGTPGADGKTSYVHFAYASGITGSLPNPTAVTGFKTTAFAGAKYIGVCTDFSQADPTAHTSYEWSEYKGADGEDGVGIASVVEQYYLSSSRTALQGGSWSDTPPAWKAGWYYWTRSKITYTDGKVEYTAGICVTGDAGTSVLAQYSADGSSWHSTFQDGDIYMRTSSDNGSTWTPGMPIVGTPGQDGQWRKFQWAKNTSTTTAPTSGWQDTPMTPAAGEYVWMRSGIVVPPATSPSSWNAATRLTGDKGESGESTYMLDLSNEVTGIACDADGNVIGSYPTSQAAVYKGVSKVTSGVTYSIAGKTGISTASVSSAGVVSMSGMTNDTAVITVQAAVAGLTLQSTISLYKVKPGNNGEDGKDAIVYDILPSVSSVSVKADGTTSVSKVQCAKYSTTGNAGKALTTENYLYGWFETEDGMISQPLVIADNTETQGQIAVSASTKAVYFELRDSTGLTGYIVLDRERVPVLADGADIIEKINDAEYLKQVFPKDETNTDISGGVVLTNIVGVRDVDSDDVEAFINGSDLGKSTTHGKLLIAGGIPSTDDYPNINLSTRASYAATRIYEDGTIFTTKLNASNAKIDGSLFATSGRIGAFWTTDQYDLCTYGKLNDGTGDTQTVLNPNFFYHRYKRTITNGEDTEIIIGAAHNKQNRATAVYDKDGNLLYEINVPELIPGLRVQVHTNKTTLLDNRDLTAIQVSAKAGSNAPAFAIHCPDGLFAGLRPNIRTITTTTVTLTEYDHTIVVNTTSKVTITLPSSPKTGQEYMICFRGRSASYSQCPLNSSDANMNLPMENKFSQSSITLYGYGIFYIVYDASAWWIYRIC